MSTSKQELRVLIVGAGPAGFYAVDEISKVLEPHPVNVSFDVINADIRPGGLVAYGVAPDHLKIRAVEKVFYKILNQSNVQYFGNVVLGRDLTLAECRSRYHIIIFSFGAQGDKKLGIPGEDSFGSYAAREIVGWYNGVPALVELPVSLETPRAIVVGAGNVAADIARILVRDETALMASDIAEHARVSLQQSKIREVVIVVRRGPEHVKFTPAELRALGELPGVLPAIAEGSDLSRIDETTLDKDAAKNLALFKEFANREKGDEEKKITFLFNATPTKVFTNGNAVTAVEIRKTQFESATTISLETGLFVRAVGYDVQAIAGVPFDETKKVIANCSGRMDMAPGMYVVGWAADGPSGIIGTNKTRAKSVAQVIREDLEQQRFNLPSDDSGLELLLTSRKVSFVREADWFYLDELELQAGQKVGRPRIRFTSNEKMLSILSAR